MASPLSSPDGSVLMNIPIVPVMDSIVTEDGMGMVLKTEVEHELEAVDAHDEEDQDINQMLNSVNADGQLIRTSHSALQSLLSGTSVSQILNQQGGIQVVTLPTAQDVISLPTDGIQFIPTKYFGLVAIPQTVSQGGKLEGTSIQMVQSVDGSDLNVVSLDNNATIIMPPAAASPEPPPGCPSWAARLKKCEKIGDSYRGYVENEVNLDVILTLHKQQTNSFWGTRQSPSTAKTSTRLMWKSQYVPFDGIPFINSGSRAVVMECQYGPRRKGAGKKSHCPTDSAGGFRQTCPARIYVKKVRKFPTYAVNLNMDKKSIRIAMDKAFHELREKGQDVWGEDRYYVQLPSEEAHDYHEIIGGPEFTKPEPPLVAQEEMVPLEPAVGKCHVPARIHPRVLDKIRFMVANGEMRLYAIRKQLRKFVLRDLYRGSRQVPERHDLTVFPTVNDLKNHIHQALTDIQNGTLTSFAPLTPPMDLQVHCVESQIKEESEKEGKSQEERSELPTLWTGSAMPETVTVTLTQNPEEDGHHIISRIETHLSDGTTQVSTTLTPETAQLLARLQPGLFRTGSLQMEGSQMPSTPTLMSEVGDSTTDTTHDLTQPVQVIPDLDMTPLVEGAHGMTTFDAAQLTNMVDIDGNVHISGMMDDVDAAHSMSSMVKSQSASHTISGIHHLDHRSAHHMPSLVDADTANLASIVTSDHGHLTTLTPGHISMLTSVDSDAMSQMVSSGAAHLSIISDSNNHVDSMSLVSADEASVGDSLSGEVAQFGEEHCVPGMAKTHLGCDEGSEPNLESDKIALHMTADQEIGMARLENKVSIL